MLGWNESRLWLESPGQTSMTQVEKALGSVKAQVFCLTDQ